METSTTADATAQQPAHGLRGVLLALLGAVCWGFSATCVSYLTTNYQVDVVWLAFARTAISGPLFLLIAFATDRQRLMALPKDLPMLGQLVAFALIGVVMIQVTYMSAVQHLGAGNALLLQETGLVLIMLFTCVRGRRLPTGTEAASLLLALFGTAAIATQGNLGGLGISAVGLAWGLAAGVALAGYNILPVRLLDKYGSFITNGSSMLLAACMLAPFAHPLESAPRMPWDGWLVFAGVVLVGTVVAYVVYLQGVKEAGPVKASLVAVFEPVSGMAISCLWLGSVVSPADLVGCAAIVVMMVLVARPAPQKD
ncbi:MAG: DMT family transporter [Coriobacteriia bacterium]|nr:DMT family transporter [Coriobacteriia bacterium]